LDLYSATTNLADLNVVVIKVLVGTADQKAKMEQRLELEVARWQHLKHPNVAELLGTARLYPERPFGMVFKWVRNPDLLSYIGEHPEAKPDKAKEIVNGVHYLHDNGVVHGDIRVDNIIITDQGQAQISDFGIAQILDTSSFMTMTQSNIRFTAPELMPTEEVDLLTVRPTSRSDIFSLGMLLLQLFHGPDTLYRRGLPYNHISSCSGYEFGMVRRIHNGQRPLRERYNPMEDKHWNLICLCWDGEPSKRPTIAEVRQAL
jgi:serine/threonine protein kinase